MKRRGFLGLFAAAPLIPKALLGFDKDTYVEIDGKVIQGVKPSESIPHTPPQLNGGGASAPAYVFTNDPDTGIYRSGADQLVIVCHRDI